MRSVTVDCVVFGLDDSGLQLLLIKRGVEPFKNQWALPGGFVHSDETLEAAAKRELQEETGIERLYLEQLYTFGAVDRDPRERVISVSYYALTRFKDFANVHASTDAMEAKWFPLGKVPKLAFDHRHIVDIAIARIRGQLDYKPIAFALLPTKFTLSQLQRVYEAILGQAIDKRNFRKKALATGWLRELDELEQGVAHRAARLYRFKPT